MKKITALLFILIGFLSCNQGFAQSNITKQKITTFGANEYIVSDEACLTLNTSKDYIFIITRSIVNSVKQFYIYDNGIRKGPFNAISEEMLKKCGEPETDCSANEPAENNENTEENPTHQISSNEITFKGKQYGPYDQVANFIITKDKSKFWAVVVIDKKYNLICSDGRKLELIGMPDRLIVSPDGNYAVIKCLGNIKSLDDIANMMTNQDAMSKVTLYTIDGKKFGPFNNETFSNDDMWFPSTCNSWFYKFESKLYKDGVFVKNLENPVYKCSFWTTPDGKRYVSVDYDKISFSDGSSFPYPLRIKLINEGGKVYVKWVSLENEKDVILYKKEL